MDTGLTSGPGRPPFRCRSEEGEFAVRLVLSGELDVGHVGDLERAVDEALAHDVRGVVIDLSELEFIDSSGIGALVRLEKRTRTSGLEIVFTRPTTAVGKILRTVGLARRFRLSDEEPERGCPICELPLSPHASRCPHCESSLP